MTGKQSLIVQQYHIFYTFITTPLGHMLLGATPRGVCFLQFNSSIINFQQRYAQAILIAYAPPWQILWQQRFSAYYSGINTALPWSVDCHGTSFQQKVWRHVQTIGAGKTLSYAQVAQHINMPRATRAVASACAANAIALLIPCHRVVRSNGTLSGYKWGIERKEYLLRLESDI